MGALPANLLAGGYRVGEQMNAGGDHQCILAVFKEEECRYWGMNCPF